MKVAILTFKGFNEIDSFVACGILNLMKKSGWKAQIACPAPSVTSMNGVVVAGSARSSSPPRQTRVVVGSGQHAAQCSGTLLLAKLGLLGLPRARARGRSPLRRRSRPRLK